VDTVGDQLQHDVGPRQGGSDDARVPVLEGAHGVEHVGDGARALVERGMGNRGRGARMAERDGDTASDQAVDELSATRQLGSECDGRHRAAAEKERGE
jgi:hypothetical protein